MAPKHRVLLIPLLVVVPALLLFSSSGYGAQEAEEPFIIISPQPSAENKEVQWNINQAGDGLQSSLKIFFERPPKTPDMPDSLGWEYRIESDGIIVIQESLPEETKEAEHLIAVDTMTDGDHKLVLSVRDFQGKLHTQERSFRINGSPRIRISALKDTSEIINPEITFTFFGERERLTGFIEVFLDDRLLIATGIKREQNDTPVTLTELIGTTLYSADLTPGTHQLTIAASGLNSSRAVRSVPVMGSIATPGIVIQSTNENRLKNIEVVFPPSSKKIVGGADIHYNHSTILSLTTEKPFLSLSSEAIEAALSKHNIKIGKPPIKMTISTYSANHIENWQEFTF